MIGIDGESVSGNSVLLFLLDDNNNAIYIYIYIYLPTPLLGQDMTQGQFLSGV